MAQHRYWDFGSPVPQESEIFVNKSLNDPGIYSGLELSVDITDRLFLTPGCGLQPDGILWEEDDNVFISFAAPGPATDYTIIATHVDEQRWGGAAVEYELAEGILSGVVDGVPVGWIYHPGGGIPLTSVMLQNVVRAKPQDYTNAADTFGPPEYQQAEFTKSFHDIPASGPDTVLLPREFTTVGQFLVYQRVTNSAGAPGVEQLVQHFPLFIQDDKRPQSIDFYCNIPNSPNNSITVQVYDTNQVIVPISGSPLNSTVGWDYRSVVISKTVGTWVNLKSYEIRLLFNLDPGQAIDLGRLQVNYWPFH